MKLPGGDDLIEHGTALVFDYWQSRIAARDGSAPIKWADLPRAQQLQWMAPQRAFAEVVAVALIADQTEVVGRYDGGLGAAYERAIARYALEELEHNPLTLTEIAQ